MSQFMPVDKVHETDLLIAFRHPRPQHKTHILIVPKRAIGSFLDLAEADTQLLADIMRTAQHLIQTSGLDETACRLITNMGDYQEVKQLHFHLVSDDS